WSLMALIPAHRHLSVRWRKNSPATVLTSPSTLWGFKADEAAQAELECISEASGGTYVEAENAEELGNQLEFLVQRDAVGYDMTGTEFEYADNIDDAKWLDEGQYQTRVKVSGTESDIN